MSHYLIPDWPALDRVKAYTSLRFDGHSNPPFNNFNLSARTDDDPVAVAANRQQLKHELELRNDPVWLSQVHGTTVVKADAINQLDPEADASYTSVPGVVCAVLTADCLPILLCNEQGSQVAAIHAGWRGLLNGVIASTAEFLHPPLEHWMAWLGPAIGPKSFEVGDEVYQQFLKMDPQASQAFQAIGPNAWYVDIYMVAKQLLAKLGIKRVYGGSFDTVTESQRFYSHRRDRGKTGRMASLIWINEL